MREPLKEKTVKGMTWSFTDNLVNTGLSFIVGIVLARLLSPHEFGIIGMIAIFIAISVSITDSGFSNALIRKNDATEADYNTVFYFNLVGSIILYLILFFSAPAISNFFKEPQLVKVTRVLGIVLIINGFAIIQRTILIKVVDFKLQTKISIIASISSGVIGIVMALDGWGVWSLVGMQIAKQILNTVFLWKYNYWRPTRGFSKQSFSELFGFGSKLLVSGIISTVYNNVFYVVIGHYYSAFQLGQYTRADQFNTIFSSNLTSAVQRVSYPVLSSIQDDPIRLKEAYKRLIKITMLITFTCMLCLVAVAKPLILLLIGIKWYQCIYYLQIICFAGMLYPLHAINLNILQVKGRSDLFLKLEIIKRTIGLAPILMGIYLGIEYMLWGSVGVSFLAYFLNAHYSAELIDYTSFSQIKDIIPTFFVSGGVALCMWGLTFLEMRNIVTLILQLISGSILSILIYEYLKLDEYIEIKHIMISVIRKL